MNLSKMLDDRGEQRTASVVDLRWLQDGLVHPGHPNFTPTGEVGTQDNNTKPALEVEWGCRDIAPLFSQQQDTDIVQRNLDPDQQVDGNEVISFARDQMNRGVMGQALVSSLRRRFPVSSLKVAKDGLRKQLALQGIVGCIAVDGRGYKSCKDAVAAASHSPFKGFIRYVIGCDCGTPHMLPDGRVMQRQAADSTGNPVDDFIAGDSGKPQVMVAHCQSTMLPILAFHGDLDESEMDQTLIDMTNVTALPQAIADKARETKTSNIRRVQMAFRELVSLRDQREAQKYHGKVDTAGFIIDTQDRPIQLIPEKKRPQLDVDPTDPASAQEVVVEKAAKTNFDGIKSVKAVSTDIDLTAAARSAIDIELTDGDNPAQLRINAAKKPVAALGINGKAAPMVADVIEFAPQEVDMSQALDPEFEGTDEVVLDDPSEPSPELEVDIRQDMTI
jgi:hypothetical protein